MKSSCWQYTIQLYTLHNNYNYYVKIKIFEKKMVSTKIYKFITLDMAVLLKVRQFDTSVL